MKFVDLVNKIAIFNEYSPVKIGLDDMGGSKKYLVVNGTSHKITPIGMTVNELWDHLDTLENFVRQMENKK